MTLPTCGRAALVKAMWCPWFREMCNLPYLLRYPIAYFVLASPFPACAINFDPVLAPKIDLSQLGRIAFTGRFDAVSQVQYAGQDEENLSNDSSYLRQQIPNGNFITALEADAAINSMCPFSTKDGTFTGICVGGSFSNLGGHETQGIGLFDPNTSNVTPLPGILGSVENLLYDPGRETIYVAGDFLGGNSTNLLAWVDQEGWTNLPFTGFNGPLNAISAGPDQTLLFGGNFNDFGGKTRPNANPPFNGLFQWDPNTATVNSSQVQPITRIAMTLEPAAEVASLVAINDTMYVAGNFTGLGLHNILSIKNGQAGALPDGGLTERSRPCSWNKNYSMSAAPSTTRGKTVRRV